MTKLLTTPALHVCEDSDAFVTGSPGVYGHPYQWWFCLSTLKDIFDLPDVKKIWLEFHDSPDVDRCHVQVIEYETEHTDMIVSVDDVRMYVSGSTGRMIADRLKRKSCYVECKFEEEVV